MSDKKAEENIERYLKTSIYTYAGAYKELLLTLPDDMAAIGRLVCDQITHPSMYFTEPSAYLEDNDLSLIEGLKYTLEKNGFLVNDARCR